MTLSDKQADFWSRILVLYVIGLSILKGLRFPGQWAQTQLIFGYDYGFVRRGFVSAVLKSIFGNHIYDYVFLQSFILIVHALCMAGFVWLSFFLLKRNRVFLIPLLVFFTSPAFVLYQNVVGYFENIGFLITLTFIALYHKLPRFAYCALYIILICMLFLIHEGQVIVWGGVLSLMLFFKMGGWYMSIRQLILTLSVAFVAFAALCAINFSFVDLTQAQAATIKLRMEARANFQIKDEYTHWMVGGADRTVTVMKNLWSDHGTRIWYLIIFTSYLPTYFYMAYVIRRYATVESVKAQIGHYCIPVLLSLSVLSLYVFGFDVQRWDACWVMAMFLMSTICVGLAIPKSAESFSLPPVSIILGICIILLNANTKVIFFDGYYPHLFPYDELVLFWNSIISEGQPFFQLTPVPLR